MWGSVGVWFRRVSGCCCRGVQVWFRMLGSKCFGALVLLCSLGLFLNFVESGLPLRFGGVRVLEFCTCRAWVLPPTLDTRTMQNLRFIELILDAPYVYIAGVTPYLQSPPKGGLWLPAVVSRFTPVTRKKEEQGVFNANYTLNPKPQNLWVAF